MLRKGDFTDSGSSPKSESGGLELNMHGVHFAVKFSEAEAQSRLRRT